MAAIDNRARIGADVGGTFTDVILQRADGSATVRKLLSTPPNYDAAVVEAAAGLAAGAHVGAGGRRARGAARGARARGRRRPRGDGRDERRPRASRCAHGARDDGGLPRRARAPPAPDSA